MKCQLRQNSLSLMQSHLEEKEASKNWEYKMPFKTTLREIAGKYIQKKKVFLLKTTAILVVGTCHKSVVKDRVPTSSPTYNNNYYKLLQLSTYSKQRWSNKIFAKFRNYFLTRKSTKIILKIMIVRHWSTHWLGYLKKRIILQ